MNPEKAPRPQDVRGIRLGRYELLTRLSAGGMAELFLACLHGPGGFRKFVTIKRILPDLREEEEFVAMFLDEARITAAMSHANIAQVFELGEESNVLYLAMEFIAGQDLHRIIKAARAAGQRIPVPFGARVIRDACLALHYAHQFTSPGGRLLPVIHRDVSTRNIMVTYDGTTKVIDFGIAKAKGALTTTRAGNVKGSPSYMSPEQIRGEELDGRSDLFAAGSVLYELLTGLRAFHSPEHSSTMFKVVNSDVEPPHTLNPDVPEPLSRVVLTALSKAPSDRFGTGRDMARAIEEAVPGLWSDDEVGAYVSRLFSDARDRSGAVLALAGELDGAVVANAAEALREEQSNSAVSPSAPINAAAQVPSGSPPVEVPAEEATRRLRSNPDMPAQPAASPPAQESPDQLLAGSNAALASVPKGEQEIVLAVDDSKVLRMLVERLLGANGYEVITASSAGEALDVLKELRPDLILLDVMMPDVDGFTLSQRIREQPAFQSTPIVFLSAACSLEERVKGLSVGGDDFIRKPFEGADLLARVRVHLQKMKLIKQANPQP